jgi:hypothetical protein
MNCFGKYSKAGTVGKADFPNGLLTKCRDYQCFALSSSVLILRDCRFRFAQTSSQMGSLPKAFQKQTSFAFGFFNAHPLNQASLFRGFALKKPITL